jgi:transcriptional regulator with XRE-family HTH domain
MLSLSLESGLNETAVRDILNGKVKNPTYNTLASLAKTLNCKVDDLALDPEEQELAIGNYILLLKSSKVNLRLFAKSVQIIDEFISNKKLNFSYLDKVKLYWSWYDLSLMNRTKLNNKNRNNIQLETLINSKRK